MDNFNNKLNPCSIALSVISELTIDEFLEIILSAGISIDMNLSTAENYSNKTRIQSSCN